MFQLPEKALTYTQTGRSLENDNNKGHLRDVLRFFPPPAFALEERLGGSRDEAAVRGRLLGGAGPSASSSLLSGKRRAAGPSAQLGAIEHLALPGRRLASHKIRQVSSAPAKAPRQITLRAEKGVAVSVAGRGRWLGRGELGRGELRAGRGELLAAE